MMDPQTQVPRVLVVPELFNVILHHTTRGIKATLAQTCKKWNGPALDSLWNHLDGLLPLMKLLSPVSSVESELGDRSWRLTRALAEADWPRFELYAARVRSLEYDDNSAMAASVFNDLGQWRPSGPLLPNMQKLTWRAIRDYSATGVLIFISPTLESLVLSLGTPVSERIGCQVIKALSRRTPRLENLEFRCQIGFTHSLSVKTALADWLAYLPGLKAVGMPAYYGTPPIVLALGRLTHLERIFGSVNRFTDDRLDPNGMKFSFKEGGEFTKLKELSFDAEIHTAISVVSAGPQLTSICLNTGVPPDPEGLQEFLGAVAIASPLLEHLQLMLSEDLNRDNIGVPGEALRYENLAPLLVCHRLSKLQVAHTIPLTLDEGQLGEMGANWPNMAVLELCQNPDLDSEPHYHSPGTPMTALRAVATSFPSLRTFGMYFSSTPVGDAEKEAYEDVEPSRSLTSLHVGWSTVPGQDTFAVGYHLALICPNVTKIISGEATWFPSTIESELGRDYLVDRESAWDYVEDVIRATSRLCRLFSKQVNQVKQRLDAAERDFSVLSEKVRRYEERHMDVEHDQPIP